MSITRFYKLVTPDPSAVDVADSQDIGGNRGLYGNYTWYHRLVQGSATRLIRYREYDVMDNDIDIARALDIVAEEITGNNPKSKLPLEVKLVDLEGQKISPSTVVTIKAALRTWCKIHQWDKRIYQLARNLVKYGDCFFYRPKDKNKRLIFIHPKNVIAAKVSEYDITEVKGWHVKNDAKKPNQYSGFGVTGMSFNVNGGENDTSIENMDADEIVRYSLNDDMSEEAPFGMSILRPIYRSFKQKELLEDAILIYRIQRAPERRVFYVDVGKMPPHKVAAHLEQIKNEIKQKKIPTQFGGKNQVESIYNPQSMSEDFFFASKDGGRGSRVETLPGGQGLGELSDLDYFYRKMWRGLRIPQSYMVNTSEDAAIANDGRVGIAYQQEIKFSLYIERLQTYIERVMDEEFKRFLYDSGIKVDATIFELILPEPSNYNQSREQSINNDLLNNYGSIKDDETMSKRFAMKKYLGLTSEEIKTNEQMVIEEKGIDPKGKNVLAQIYYPDEAEAGGFDGGLGGGFDNAQAPGDAPSDAEFTEDGENELDQQGQDDTDQTPQDDSNTDQQPNP